MAFNRKEPMYYLVDFRGVKAGTPVKVRQSDLSRLRLLGSRGVIGSMAELNGTDSTLKRVAQQGTPVEPVVDPVEETPVEPVVEPTEDLVIDRDEDLEDEAVEAFLDEEVEDEGEAPVEVDKPASKKKSRDKKGK